ELFRNRSFTISVIAMFVASMAFFAPIVFLPRWFQVVGGASATQSGYQILALLGGLILSAILSGQLVARTGRYKPLALGASVVLAIGLFLLSNLRADTPLPLLWSWMFVTGIGGAIHRAFSLATASTFDFGIVAALVAVVMVVFLREAPMRGPVREEATAAPPSPDRQPSPLAGEAGK